MRRREAIANKAHKKTAIKLLSKSGYLILFEHEKESAGSAQCGPCSRQCRVVFPRSTKLLRRDRSAIPDRTERPQNT